MYRMLTIIAIGFNWAFVFKIKNVFLFFLYFNFEYYFFLNI